jgi:REP element-mobilizing transposase RayT
MPAPIYTADNCRFAYQLNWSLSIFSQSTIAATSDWLSQLKLAVEPDGVRILEYRSKEADVHQFLLSTVPHVTPSEVVRSVKGRLQYLLREQIPHAFRRNYHLHSIGSAKREAVEQYVKSQLGHHRMADARVQQRLRELQIHRPQFDLGEVRGSAHGQFMYNLHLVLVRREREIEIGEETLRSVAAMVERASDGHEHLLSAAGVLADHVHLALGCGMTESPMSVALSYLNNLAYAEGMRAVYEYGAYLGTFGEYDLGAVRAAVRG